MVLRPENIHKKFRIAHTAEQFLGLDEDSVAEGLATHPVALQLGIAKSFILIRAFGLTGDEMDLHTLRERSGDAGYGNFLTILHRTPTERILDLVEEKRAGSTINLVNAIWDNFKELRADKTKPRTIEECVSRWPILAKAPGASSLFRSYLRTIK
jgi:hypothetical protein